jgi:hypothetical protein
MREGAPWMELAVSGFVLDASSQKNEPLRAPLDFLPRISTDIYSDFKTTIGSTFVALRAGM